VAALGVRSKASSASITGVTAPSAFTGESGRSAKRKSLLPGMLMHACYNFTFFFLTQIWTPQHPVVTISEWLAASYVAAAIVIIAGRRTLLARAPG
jgi:hypothetical protein